LGVKFLYRAPFQGSLKKEGGKGAQHANVKNGLRLTYLLANCLGVRLRLGDIGNAHNQTDIHLDDVQRFLINMPHILQRQLLLGLFHGFHKRPGKSLKNGDGEIFLLEKRQNGDAQFTPEKISEDK